MAVKRIDYNIPYCITYLSTALTQNDQFKNKVNVQRMDQLKKFTCCRDGYMTPSYWVGTGMGVNTMVMGVTEMGAR